MINLLFFCSCYPINTILVDFNKLDQYMASHPNPYDFSDESSSDSDDEDDSGSDSSVSAFYFHLIGLLNVFSLLLGFRLFKQWIFLRWWLWGPKMLSVLWNAIFESL